MNPLKPLSACLLGLMVFASGLSAQQDFNAASESVDSDLKAAQQELAELRNKITEEKVPLAREINELEKQDLRKQVNSLKETNKYVSGQLMEFVNTLNSQMSVSERQHYGEALDAAKNAPINVNMSEEEKLAQQFAVVDMAVGRLDDQIGGFVFEGSALSPEGLLKDGKFVLFGPSLFFASADGSVVGLIEDRSNVADPVVVDVPQSFNADLVGLINGGQGVLPADPSGGKAIKIEKQRESYFEHIQKGQIVGYVIIGLGILALLLGLFKVFEIGGFATAQKSDVQATLDLLSQGNQEEALKRAEGIKGEAGEMLLEGVRHFKEKRGVIEELMFEKILKVRPRLERFLPFLAITAAAAPLLGLLGTVIGMIKTFNLITIFGTGDARSLSTGISEALVTTELGLTVAIPVLILHGLLSRYAKRKLASMEENAVSFVNGISTMK
jgi:biopolymer transport protein ExbB